MTDYVVRDTQLTSVADAIRAKGGTSAPLAFPDGFVDAVDAIPTGGGGGSVAAKEVNFRDYDGTVVYSYTPAEFAALTAMPDNPDHSGDAIPLTSQGWNWSFAEAQEYVAKYGRLEVGQMYATADGKTHVLIHLEQGRTSPILGCCPNGSVDVDWGDGTAHDTLTGTSVTAVKWTPRHEYAAPGDYDIVLTCSGTMGFYGSISNNQYSGLLRYTTVADTRNHTYQKAIRAIRCADNVSHIGDYAFKYCSALKNITLPNNDALQIGANSFEYCCALTSITLPLGVTNINTQTYRYCYSLSSLVVPSSVTNIYSSPLSSCYCLTSICIPDSITTIPQSLITQCYSITRAVIPSSVTLIGENAFNSCYGLAELHFLPTTPPTVNRANAFTGIPTDCKIYVPAGSLEAYTSAANYPSASTYTYIEE